MEHFCDQRSLPVILTCNTRCLSRGFFQCVGVSRCEKVTKLLLTFQSATATVNVRLQDATNEEISLLENYLPVAI